MNRTSLVLALLLVASLGFSVGQATSQPADAGHAQVAKIQKVRDSQVFGELRIIFGMLKIQIEELRDIEAQEAATCRNVRDLNTGFPPSCIVLP